MHFLADPVGIAYYCVAGVCSPSTHQTSTSFGHLFESRQLGWPRPTRYAPHEDWGSLLASHVSLHKYHLYMVGTVRKFSIKSYSGILRPTRLCLVKWTGPTNMNSVGVRTKVINEKSTAVSFNIHENSCSLSAVNLGGSRSNPLMCESPSIFIQQKKSWHPSKTTLSLKRHPAHKPLGPHSIWYNPRSICGGSRLSVIFDLENTVSEILETFLLRDRAQIM